MGVRRSGVLWRVALVLACLLILPLLSSPASGTVAGSLTASRSRGLPGESLTFRGTLPTRVVRPVQLQRQLGSTWYAVVSGKTASTGALTLATRLHAMPTNYYRVFAKAVTINGRRYGALATPTRSVVADQQDTVLTLPARATQGAQASAVVKTWPVRTGRPVALQSRNPDGSWTDVGGPLATDSTGAATIAFTVPAPGTTTYRARSLGWNGVGWYPSFPVVLEVAP
ncbi:hypothetical protein [Nocardioides cavernaquae]|uniref:Uncharacterized protein n=1 Tax=Nocardioides cavernaquae TaxID=2321396 RepID=A0A3A5HGD1_9ACTN|nr:hypothetical protein [Nocardioides cavernaquae]RJS47114.1 hypothetical protein D4739_13380 [Nocardioides cavernaquae]